MDPFSAIATTLIGGGLNAWGADAQNRFNAGQAGNQMDFQRVMFDKQVELANSAHQREVEDLKKAGLNPILSVNKGADSPSGGSGAMATGANIGASFTAGAKDALDAYQGLQGLALQGQQTASNVAKQTAETALTAQKTRTESFNTNLAAEAEKGQEMSNAVRAAGLKTEKDLAPVQHVLDAAVKGSATLNNTTGSINNILRPIIDKMSKVQAPANAKEVKPEKWLGRDERDAMRRQQLLDDANAAFKQR